MVSLCPLPGKVYPPGLRSYRPGNLPAAERPIEAEQHEKTVWNLLRKKKPTNLTAE